MLVEAALPRGGAVDEATGVVPALIGAIDTACASACQAALVRSSVPGTLMLKSSSAQSGIRK